MSYPIVLAHGICRFDVWNQASDGGDGHHYFKSVRSKLDDEGFSAEATSVPWAADVDERAEVLRQEVLRVLRNQDAEKVHIIAHSMGGLDARHMLFNYRGEGLHARVASVTTIGTPHAGTVLADAGVAEAAWAIELAERIGLDLNGFPDLTREACASFNQRAASFERGCGVPFRTFAGIQPFIRVFLPLKASWLYIHEHEGDNDGLVPRSSARWRDDYFGGTIDADHLNETAWGDADEVFGGHCPLELEHRMRRFYVDVARSLPRS